MLLRQLIVFLSVIIVASTGYTPDATAKYRISVPLTDSVLEVVPTEPPVVLAKGGKRPQAQFKQAAKKPVKRTKPVAALKKPIGPKANKRSVSALPKATLPAGQVTVSQAAGKRFSGQVRTLGRISEKTPVSRQQIRVAVGKLREAGSRRLEIKASQNSNLGSFGKLRDQKARLGFAKLLSNGKIREGSLKGLIPGNSLNNFTSSPRISRGYKHNFQFNGRRVEVKWHGPDSGAPKGSNSQKGWTAQIKIGKRLLGVDGKLYRKPSNKTHIPVKF